MTEIRVARRLACGLAALAFAAGCASSGPRTIPKDRVNYQEALSSSAKTQLLLNLVRVRYVDPPIFLEVASIVNSYSWDAGASAGVEFGPGAEKYGLDANGAYGDHPTISYSPLSGEKFSRSMMTPLTPQAVLSLVQVGYPVDAVFRLCVKSVNGVSNQSGSSSSEARRGPVVRPVARGAPAHPALRHGGAPRGKARRRGDGADRDARRTFGRARGRPGDRGPDSRSGEVGRVQAGVRDAVEPRRRDRAPDPLDARDHGGARRGHRRAGAGDRGAARVAAAFVRRRGDVALAPARPLRGRGPRRRLRRGAIPESLVLDRRPGDPVETGLRLRDAAVLPGGDGRKPEPAGADDPHGLIAPRPDSRDVRGGVESGRARHGAIERAGDDPSASGLGGAAVPLARPRLSRGGGAGRR